MEFKIAPLVGEEEKDLQEEKHSFLGTVGGFAKGMAQESARSLAGIGKEMVDVYRRQVLGKEALPDIYADEDTTIGKIQKFLYGEEPIRGIESAFQKEYKPMVEAGAKYLEEKGGIVLPEKLKGVAAPIIGSIFMAADFTGMGGEKAAIKSWTKQSSKSIIKKELKQAGFADELLESTSEAIAKTSKESDVQRIVDDAKRFQMETKQVPKQTREIAEDSFVGVTKKGDPIIKQPDVMFNPKTKQFEFDTPKLKRPTSAELKTGLKKQYEFGIKSGVPIKEADNYRNLKIKLNEASKASRMGYRAGVATTKKEIKQYQKTITDYIKESLPVEKRGALLTTVKGATTEAKLNRAIGVVDDKIEKYVASEAKRVEKNALKTELRSSISDAQLNRAGRADVYKKAGIDDISKATPEQFRSAINITQDKKAFKESEGLMDYKKTKKDFIETEDDIISQIEFEGMPEKKTLKQKVSKNTKNINQKISHKVDQFIGVTSTRLNKISPKLMLRMRKYYLDINKNIVKQLKPLNKMENALKKMSEIDRNVFIVAMTSGVKNSRKIALDVAKRNDVEKELSEMFKNLDNIRDELKNIGTSFSDIENYIPRSVKDSEGLMEYLRGADMATKTAIEDALNQARKGLGKKTLTAKEEAEVINSLIRGYGFGGITIKSPKGLKGRLIDEVTPKMTEFYDNPLTAYQKYIEDMNKYIQQKKLFGANFKKLAGEQVSKTDIESTVGGMVSDMIRKGNIKQGDEQEVMNILQDLMNTDVPNKMVSEAKNLTTLLLLGSPLNAITQLGDLVISMYKNGFGNTIAAGLDGFLKKNKIKPEDLGIMKHAAEFDNKYGLAKTTDKILNVTGFNAIDKFGKETFLNAALKKADSNVNKFFKTGNKEDLGDLNKIFLEDGASERVAKKIKNGKYDDDEVQFYLFNKLSEAQPITDLELPSKYKAMPNGRILYALKSWSIKTLDIYRTTGVQEIKKGIASGNKKQVAKGVGNIATLTTLLTTAGVATDTIKDIIQGKEIDLEGSATDSFLQIAMMNRYALSNMERKGVGTAAMESAVPIISPINDFMKDITQTIPEEGFDISEFKGTKYVPIFGKLYYSLFGKGSEYTKKQEPGTFKVVDI